MPSAVTGVGGFFTFVCLCLAVIPHDISKTDAARITNFDIELFRDDSWKPIYFGGQRSRSQVTNVAVVGLCTLV